MNGGTMHDTVGWRRLATAAIRRSWRKPLGVAALFAIVFVSLLPAKPVEANTPVQPGQKCLMGANCPAGKCLMYTTSPAIPSATHGTYCAASNNDGCGMPGQPYGKPRMTPIWVGGKKHYCESNLTGFVPAKANGTFCSTGNMCASDNCGRTLGTERACAPAGFACVTPNGVGFNLNETRSITVNNTTGLYRCDASAVVPVSSAGSECQNASQCAGANPQCSTPTKTDGVAIFTGALGARRCHSTSTCPWTNGAVANMQKKIDLGGTEYRCVSQGGQRWLRQKGAGQVCTSNSECSSYNCTFTNTSQVDRKCSATGPGAPSIGAA
ncbi:MAG: hypothetical protein KIT84_37675 [Labilithrix sp.]|nr:hypothetical protein [Labilithrix sp.]